MATPYTTRTVAKVLTSKEVKKVLKEEKVPTSEEVDNKINEAITGAINATY